jgi:hypothetical protein
MYLRCCICSERHAMDCLNTTLNRRTLRNIETRKTQRRDMQNRDYSEKGVGKGGGWELRLVSE